MSLQAKNSRKEIVVDNVNAFAFNRTDKTLIMVFLVMLLGVLTEVCLICLWLLQP